MEIFTRFKPPKSPVVMFTPGSTKTRSEFLQESDINRLVERFRDTGSFYDPLTSVKSSQNKPLFGDFTNIPDYQHALNIVIEAEQRFAALPSKVRERFQNDPQQLIDFVSDEKNREEAIELGFLPKPVVTPSRSSDDKPPEKSDDKPPEKSAE